MTLKIQQAGLRPLSYINELKRHRGAVRGCAGQTAEPGVTEPDFSACNALDRVRRGFHPRTEHRILAQTSSIRVQVTDDAMSM
jgi:hypothetical protein